MSRTSIETPSESGAAPDHPTLQQLAIALVDDAGAVDTGIDSAFSDTLPADHGPPTLRLEDLLANDHGEVILDAAGPVAIQSDGHVVDAGHRPDHVTAEGEDVSGYAYLTFDTGLTIYYPGDADVIITALTV